MTITDNTHNTPDSRTACSESIFVTVRHKINSNDSTTTTQYYSYEGHDITPVGIATATAYGFVMVYFSGVTTD